jgi:hypothetical protein
MQKPLKVFLFDVDGVIIEPIAYKIGINKTLELLCNKMGLSNIKELLPQKTEIAYLESCGIFDDWDITNILFAFILTSTSSYFKQNRQFVDLGDNKLDSKLLAIKTFQPQTLRPDYIRLTDKLVINNGSSHPPDSALEMLSSMLNNEMAEFNSTGWIGLLRDFLVGTRSVYSSHGTKFFQNIILGKNEFEKTYGLTSEWDGPALLQTEDRVLINNASIKNIKELVNNNDYRLAIYTARPSLPPQPIQSGYSPEAEIAAQMAQLTNIPLMGLGMMQWLAEKYKERPEDLIKPNTTQAIAAMLAALTRTVDASVLEEAYTLDKKKMHPDQTRFSQFKNQNLLIYVFEDVKSGVQAVLNAGEELREHGYKISVKPLGIAQDKNKKASLEKYCHRIFPHVNEALEFALAD